MQTKAKSVANYMGIRYEVQAKNEENFEKAEALALKAMAWYEIAAGNMEALDNE